MKEKLSYMDVCILKVLAITMVITSHFYRFFYTDSPLYFLKSIGFFGAALFAFLSGYLAQINCSKIKDCGWLFKRIITVYIPFLFINILSLFIYNNWNKYIVFQILFGINDGVLWYVPFIMLFYFLFYFKTKNKLNDFILVSIAILIFIFLMLMRIDSQWYTSIGALITGVLVGKVNNNKVKNITYYIMWGGVILLISIILSRYFDFNLILKDVFTSIAGIGFCGMLFNLFMILPEYDLCINISFINSLTYWIYLIHMKIGCILTYYNIFSFISYIIITILVAILLIGTYDHLKINRKLFVK